MNWTLTVLHLCSLIVICTWQALAEDEEKLQTSMTFPESKVVGVHCSRGCQCAPLTKDRGSHVWQAAEYSYLLQRLLIGSGTQYQHRHQRDGLRRMNCIGLTRLPTDIPPDLKKLVIYGHHSAPGPVRPQQSQLIDEEFLQRAPAALQSQEQEFFRLAFLERERLSKSPRLQELFLEGNTIPVIAAGTFENLNQLTLLSLRRNGISKVHQGAFDGLIKLKDLDLSRNNIVHIDRNVLKEMSNVQKLRISRNQLVTLSTDDFTNLPSLTTLDLSYNLIAEVKPKAFAHTQKLRSVDLSHNQLRSISINWTANLVNVTSMDVSHNKITTLTAGALIHLESLRHADMSFNELKTIENGLFPSNLHTLNLANNRISVIKGSAFSQLRWLKKLRLAYNQLSSLSQGIFRDLSSLQQLGLGMNRIRFIRSGHFHGLEKLRMLHMSNNAIERVDEHSFKGLRELREVVMNNNLIKEIQANTFLTYRPSAYKTSKVSWLFLHNNSIETIARDAFVHVPFLRYLSLSHNKIDTLDPQMFQHNTYLINLMLDNNRLRAIPDFVFRQQVLLKNLELQYNFIERVNGYSFAGMQRLGKLLLNNNHLTFVHPSAFLGHVKLKKIDLQQNRLPSFPFESLLTIQDVRQINLAQNLLQSIKVPRDAPQNVGSLNIYGNQFERLNPGVLKMMRPYGVINLGSNPWSCDCNLLWIKSAGTTHPGLFDQMTPATCYFPEQLRDDEVLTLPDYEFACHATLSLAERHPNISRTQTCSSSLDDVQAGITKRSPREIIDWHASILSTTENGEMLCSGVRLGPNWLITSASCWLKIDHLQNVMTVFGRSKPGGGEMLPDRLRKVSRIVPHLRYDTPNDPYDIALVRLYPVTANINMTEGTELKFVNSNKNNNNSTSETTESLENVSYPCILSEEQLVSRLAQRVKGKATVKRRDKPALRIVPRSAIPSSRHLCLRETYICAVLYRTPESRYNSVGSPVFYDMREEWGLGGLRTDRVVESKSKKKVQRAFLPLFSHVRWIERVMAQYAG